MSKNENVEWLRRRKELLQSIEKFEPQKDRIVTTTQLSFMHNAIHESVLGWANWVNGWISIELSKKIKIKNQTSASLTDSELKELHNKFKEFAIKFIEMDIRYTELINKKLAKNLVEMGKESSNESYKKMIV